MSDNNAGLPAGWSGATLPDLISGTGELTDGDWVETADQDPAGEVRLTQLADVGDGIFRDRSHRFMSREKARELRCTFLESGDVLIARMPDPLGRACVFPGSPRPCVTVVDVCVIRPGTSAVIPHWLMYFVNSPRVRTSVSALQAGSTRKRISKANLSTIRLPVPPTGEQRRIVAAIDSYFSRLDAATATLERAQCNLERYRASVLKAAVEGRLVPTEAEIAKKERRSFEPASELLKRILVERRRKWEEAELAKMIAKGKAPGDDRWKAKYVEPAAPATESLPELPEGWCWASLNQLISQPLVNGRSVLTAEIGFPVLRLTAIRDGMVDLSERKIGAWTAAEASDHLVEANDFFVVRGNGSRHLVGRGGLVAGTPEDVAFPDTLIRIRVDAAHLHPRFLRWLWDSQIVRRHFESRSRTTAGIYKINQQDIEETLLPLPPYEEQERIVAEIDRIDSVANAALSSARHLPDRIARVRQSILKWAFEGRLVDQDPTDEPASVLLDRIRMTRTGDASARLWRHRGVKPRRTSG